MPRHSVNNLNWIGFLTALTLASLTTQAKAQVIPDNTLGNGNNSVTSVTGNRTDITGGLQRNSSLFHSFDRFDINTNQQVYFANPAAIRNIFSRVTGSNISNIDGLLGVAGPANLFFMNPNGIIFGANARLDVSGSFLATTANVMEFADNQRFEATGNRQVPLVEVNIPIGLQHGATPPAMLTNRGNLATGQNLTLAADNLDLQGQLQAGQNLILNATNTVKIRDTVTEPFVARSGGNMTIQGNQAIDILALNHLYQTPFISSGNLSLVSGGIISGDAHFTSGGNFSIHNLSGTPGSFLSLYDPIIRSVGDVEFGDYRGASLKVEAAGSIRATGNIDITQPDTGIPLGSDPEAGILRNGRALILRAGSPVAANLNLPSTQPNFPTNFTPQPITSPGSITVGGGISTSDNSSITNDPVILSATGPIRVTGTFGNASIFGGSIEINTPDTVNIAGNLFVRRDVVQKAGDVVIGNINQPSSVTIGGAISTRNLLDVLPAGFTRDPFNNTNNPDGGNVFIRTSGTLSITGAFNTNTGVSAPVDPVLNPANIVSIASEARNGRGGNIDVEAGGAINLAAGISSASNFDGAGGNVVLTGASIDTRRGVITSRNDGQVIVNPNLVTPSDPNSSLSFVPNPGVGGDVTLTATSGDIRVNDIIASSNNNNSSNGFSAINLISDQGSVFVDQAELSTTNIGSHWAGDVRITAANLIQITGSSTLQSNGYFGIIDLRTTGNGANSEIIITDSDITATLPEETALFTGANPHPASFITIDSTNVTVNGSTISTSVSGFQPDPAVPTQDREANSGNINISASQTMTATDSSIRTTASSFNRNGVAGNVEITAGAMNGLAIQLNNTGIDAAAFAIPDPNNSSILGGQTGGVRIEALNRGDISLIGQRTIFTDTFGSRPTGDLMIKGGNILIDGYTLNASVNSTGGNGGNILIDGTSVTVQNNSVITTETDGAGKSGDITIQSSGGNLTFSGNTINNDSLGAIKTTVNDGATGSGGNITLNSNGGQITFDSGFEVNSATNTVETAAVGGKGGNVLINSGTGQILVNGDSTIDASTNGVQAGGSVSLISNNQAIQLNSGTISTSVGTNASANGGSITVQSNGGNITLGDTNAAFKIDAQTQTTNPSGSHQENGIGGNIVIDSNGGDVKLASGSTVQAGTTGTKDSGTVTIQANGGNLALDSSSVSTSATSSGNAGDIKLRGLQSLQLNTSQITAATETSQAGNLTVNQGSTAADFITLNNSFLSLAATDLNGAGTAGNIFLNTQQLTVQANSSISASTAGSGLAGSLTVSANGGASDSIALSGNSRLTLSATGSGDAGSVLLDTQQVTLVDSQVSASTVSGTGGNVTLRNLNSLQLNNSLISASTNNGSAGNVAVNATTLIDIDGTFPNSNQGGIIAEATNGGNAGSINLTTPTLNITNGASVAVSSANGAGTAGNVTIEASAVNLSNGAQISAETDAGGLGAPANINLQGLQTLNVNNSLISSSTNSGVAGNVTIDATGRITLDGTDARFVDSNGNPQGGIAAAATGGGTAGSVQIDSNDRLTIRNGASITVSSPAGVAGNLTVDTSNIYMDQGIISAEAGQGDGANITLTLDGNLLLMRNGSLISANATGAANGGNITIEAPFIVGLTFEDSDIVANAVQGQGGDIDITTNVIVGLRFRPQRTPLSDITASSQFGSSGTVALNTLTTDATQGISTPTIVFDDVSQIVKGACEAVGAKATTNSELRLVSRAGVQVSPTAPLPAETATRDWVSLEMSPEVPVSVTFSDGKTVTLEPGQPFQLQAICVRSWREQQQQPSSLSNQSTPSK